jgi:DNA-binding PadR family transcriptional regulator
MTRNAEPDGQALSLAEWAALALLCEGDAHGWLLVRALAADGAIGSVWTVRRALVYRSIDALEGRGLIVAAGSEASPRGPERTVYAATTRGRRAVRAWLGEPVTHVRDLRSELLLKLVLGRRAGVEQRRMLARQKRVLGEIAESLSTKDAEAAVTEKLLLRFRLETTRAAARFVEGELENEGRPTGGGGGPRSGMAG